MNKLALIIAAALAVATVAPLQASAQQRWAIATSSTGSGPYIIGSAIANSVNDSSDTLAVSAQTSGGYNNNLVLVSGKQSNSGLTFLSDLIEAYNGTGSFAELPKGAFGQLRRMFPVTTTTVYCVVPADSSIRSFDDLRGRKLNINVAATSTNRANKAIIAASGMSLDDFKTFEIATSKSYDALQDGIVEATCNFQPFPSSSIEQLAASMPIRILPISDQMFDTVNQAYANTMRRVTIPADSYPGQTEAVMTFAAPEVLFTHADQDEEAVYAFTKAYWEGQRPTSAGFGGITIEDALGDFPIPLHPGTARYLREKGLID